MYPNYFKKKILKQLSEDGLIINNKNISKNGQLTLMLDVSDVEEINGKFTSIFDNDENNNIYKYIEEFEFNKGYRHSVLFEITNFNMEKLEQLVSEQLFNSNDETKVIGAKLDEFITGIEVNSDLPSVKMIWPENGIKIGVHHNYKERQYSFFMYYDELGDSKERMDYVREYLMQSYRQLEEETLIN